MDFSFVAAPSYTREASFGIGGAASGLYRLDRTDSIMQPSDISINGNMSVEGMYVINIRGNNNFKGNKVPPVLSGEFLQSASLSVGNQL